MEVFEETRSVGMEMEETQSEASATMTHDPLCPPGIKGSSESCLTCLLLRKARQDEISKLISLAEAAYVRGREDAAVAVREFSVHSIPFLPSDTPLSMSVRVKDILSIAAMGVRQPDAGDPA
jgi:hypothetical protein